jgi:hypothetical protein
LFEKITGSPNFLGMPCMLLKIPSICDLQNFRGISKIYTTVSTYFLYTSFAIRNYKFRYTNFLRKLAHIYPNHIHTQ